MKKKLKKIRRGGVFLFRWRGVRPTVKTRDSRRMFYHLPRRSLSIRSPGAPALAACPMLRSPISMEIRKVLFQLVPTRSSAFCLWCSAPPLSIAFRTALDHAVNTHSKHAQQTRKQTSEQACILCAHRTDAYKRAARMRAKRQSASGRDTRRAPACVQSRSAPRVGAECRQVGGARRE